MNPTEKPLTDNSCYLIPWRLTSYSGGYVFLSFWLKSVTTLKTSLFLDCVI